MFSGHKNIFPFYYVIYTNKDFGVIIRMKLFDVGALFSDFCDFHCLKNLKKYTLFFAKTVKITLTERKKYTVII